VQEFESLAVAQGYEVLIGSTSYKTERTESLIRRMLQRNVDGVAVMTFGIEEELVQKLVEREFPLVFVDAGPDLPNIRVLKVNYGMGIRQAVQHLAALGHRSIAFITGPLHLRSALARRDAFLKGMAELASLCLRSTWCRRPHHGRRHWRDREADCVGGTAHGNSLLERHDGDWRAACALSHHHSVPQQVSIVGFDDIHLAQFMLPPLTTVQMSCTDLATAAVEALRAGIEKDHPKAKQTEWQISTQLVVRQSSAFPRGRCRRWWSAARAIFTGSTGLDCGSGRDGIAAFLRLSRLLGLLRGHSEPKPKGLRTATNVLSVGFPFGESER